jgi:TctA family transporter
MPSMSNPPPARGKEPPLERLMQLRAGYAALPRARRELIIFGLALLCGLLAVPLLIWAAGNRVLGPYTHGQNMHAGPLALLADFFTGLLHGSLVFWAVALGPAVLLLLLRLLVTALRAAPPARGGR